MPSTPQVLPTVKVWDYVTDPTTGLPVPQGTPVTVTWKILQGSVTNPIVQAVPKSQTLYTDANGFWTMTVVPTDRLSPANSTYHVSDGYNSYDVNPILTGYPGGDGWQALNIRVAPAPAVLAPAGQTVGPLTTGNLQVNGTLGVTGATTLAGSVTISGAFLALTGNPSFLSLGGVGSAGIVGGTTGLIVYNNAQTLANLTMTDAGAVTIRGSLAVNGAFLSLGASPGELLMSGAGQAIIGGGTTGLAIWNNALGVKNLDITDAGNVTVRGSLSITLSQILMGGLNPIINMNGAGTAQITGGTAGFQIANNAATLVNLGVTDAGAVTIRAGLTVTTGGITANASAISQDNSGNAYWDAVGATGQHNWRANNAALTPMTLTSAGRLNVPVIGLTGDLGSGIAAQLTLTNTTGIGNGANTNMQSPVIGTGGGPANAVLVTKWLKIWDGVTARWIPAFT